MSQQVGITLGTPVMSAIAMAPDNLLDGLAAAIAVDAALCLVVAYFAGVTSRSRALRSNRPVPSSRT